jgi:hypothetical protein
MPSINQTTITRNIGPASVYVDCTAPAVWTAIALGAGGVPTGGRDLGATQGESGLRYVPNIEGVEIEQVRGMVAPHVTGEEIEISCTVMERTYDNLLVAFSQGTGSTSGGKDKISVGDKSDVPLRCVALVARSADQDTYDVALLYQAYVSSGLNLAYKRGEARGVPITFRGVPLHSRAVGDHLGQWLEDVVPA